MAFKGLIKTAWHAKIASLFASASAKDYEEILGELEELLILADISLPVVSRIMAGLRKKTSRTSPKEECLDSLKQELLAVFPRSPAPGP